MIIPQIPAGCTEVKTETGTIVKCGECTLYDATDPEKVRRCIVKPFSYLAPEAKLTFRKWDQPLTSKFLQGLKFTPVNLQTKADREITVATLQSQRKLVEQQSCRALRDIEVLKTASRYEDGKIYHELYATSSYWMLSTEQDSLLGSWDSAITKSIEIATANVGGDARDDVIIRFTNNNNEISYLVYINETSVSTICREPEPPVASHESV